MYENAVPTDTLLFCGPTVPSCQVMVYGVVPPLTSMIAVPSMPKHWASCVVGNDSSGSGSVIVMTDVASQPLRSVTVYVCWPAYSVRMPVPSYCWVPAYGVPPSAVTLTLVASPWQSTGSYVTIATSSRGSARDIVSLALHPPASVMVYV